MGLTVEDVQRASCRRGVPLQPLQPVQDLQLLVSSVQDVADLGKGGAWQQECMKVLMCTAVQQRTGANSCRAVPSLFSLGRHTATV